MIPSRQAVFAVSPILFLLICLINTEITESSCPDGWNQSIAFQKTKCYYFGFTVWTDFFTGIRNCRSLAVGSDLLVIQNAFENSEIAESFSYDTRTWLAVEVLNGHWEVVGGKNITYSNWAPGFPSDNPRFKCGHVWSNDRQWVNDDCNNPRRIVCQKDAT